MLLFGTIKSSLKPGGNSHLYISVNESYYMARMHVSLNRTGTRLPLLYVANILANGQLLRLPSNRNYRIEDLIGYCGHMKWNYSK